MPGSPFSSLFQSFAEVLDHYGQRITKLTLELNPRRGFDIIHACNPPDTIFLIGGFYKLFGSRRVAELSEDAFRRAGLTRMFGSPVTVLAERCAPS
jgi:hypothetical protein